MRAWLDLHQGQTIGLLVLGIVATACGPAETEVGQTGEAAFGLVRRDFETIAPRVVIATTPFIVAGQRFVIDPGERSMAGRLRVELPARAEDAITMSTDDGFAITVREVDAVGRGRVDRGVVTYPRADGTSMWLGADDGAEEWLYLPQGTTSGRIATYRVTGATLRQHVTAVDLYDEGGRARATVSAPGAWGADGEDVPVWVEAEGDTVVLRTERGVAGPLLVDPSWVSVGSMGTARRWHAAALLPSGNVLVAGGEQQLGSILLKSAEVYDHATKTWSPTAPMSVKRSQHCSVVLPDGRIFVGCTGVPQADIYDEETATWTLTANMQLSPTAGKAVILLDDRLLMTGGALAQAYDPVADAWDTLAPPLSNRNSHAIKLLPDGRVLIAGGQSQQSGNKSAEVYDPALDAWSAAGSMAKARGYIAPLVQLQDGRLLVAGGYQSGSFPDAELFDPTTNQWTGTSPMTEDRYVHRTTILDDGTALVVGGFSGGAGVGYASTEIFSPMTETWASGPSMIEARASPTLTVLIGGQLLVAGGDDGGGTSLKSTEYLGSTPGNSCVDDSDCMSSACSGGICCATECPDLPCGSCAEASGAPEDGTCVLFQGIACDDGAACTTQDACGDVGCVGQTVQCPPPEECESKNACAPETGLCTPKPKSDGTPCSIGACADGECAAQTTVSSGASAGGSGGGGSGGGSSGGSTVSVGGSGVSASASSTIASSGGDGNVAGGGPACGCRVEDTQEKAPPTALLLVALLAGMHRRAKRPHCMKASSC